jgi:hypothetical protein
MKQMKDKKGQAVFEFLLTYGWAILCAVIVIGVLAWLGVFDINSYSKNKCLAENFCNNLNMEYLSMTDMNNEIWCKDYVTENMYEKRVYRIKWDILKEKYPECEKIE